MTIGWSAALRETVSSKATLRSALAASSWLPPTIVIMVTLGMLIASPVWGGPDAPIQQITAWYDIHHIVPGSAVNAPITGVIIPCFAHHASVAASCVIAHPVPDPQSLHVAALNYPPLFYWIVGIGQEIGSLFGASAVSTGGRLAAALACLSVVALASWILTLTGQRSALWLLPVVITPMATFLFAGSNSNGLEIALAMLFVALLYAWRRRIGPDPTTRHRRLVEIALALGALAFAATKPDAWLWIGLITSAAVIRWRAQITAPALLRLAAVCTPAIAFDLIWSSLYPTVIKLSGVPHLHALESLPLTTRIERTLHGVPTLAMQAWGVLGWLDTSPGHLFWVLLAVGTAFFLLSTVRSAAEWWYLAIATLIVFGVAIAVRLIEWIHWPNFWQGRYSLPLIVGFALLLFDDREGSPRAGVLSWAGFGTVCSAWMVALVDFRFAAGLRGFGPASFTPLLHDPVRTTALAVIVGLLMVLGCVLMAVDLRRPRAPWSPPTS